MPADLSWLIGKRLIEAHKKDYTWFFVFSGGGCISTESAWRFVKVDHIHVTSEDDGQLFGLKEPINAGSCVLEATREANVLECRVTSSTADLQLEFGGGTRLEFLTMSSGYEAWRTQNGSGVVFCTGGGKLTVLPPNQDV
jgi:hypothetical protein